MDETLTNLRNYDLLFVDYKETVYLVNLEREGPKEFERYIDALHYLVGVLTGPNTDFPKFDDITESYVLDLLKSRIKKVTKTTQIEYEGLKK